MTARAIKLLAVVALTTSAIACAPKPPDYQSILAKSSTTAATTTTATEKPVPLSQYLESIGVTGKQSSLNCYAGTVAQMQMASAKKLICRMIGA